MSLKPKSDITLTNPPLVEAWLEIRWNLKPIEPPQIMQDPGFKFALGWFYGNIKGEFPFREDLPAAETQEEMFPHVVRHRFRPARNKWPVIQIGPGVATVNFVGEHGYDWAKFADRAKYLRQNLIEAYGNVTEDQLRTKSMRLRYRNAEPFDYDQNSILEFMAQYLNISIEFPENIPGNFSLNSFPDELDLNFEFRLENPKSIGTMKLATGIRQPDQSKQMLWETSVISKDKDSPDLYDVHGFEGWLTHAHNVCHEWFFTLIEGPLRNTYN